MSRATRTAVGLLLAMMSGQVSVSRAGEILPAARQDPPHQDGEKFYNPYSPRLVEWSRITRLHESEEPLRPPRGEAGKIAHQQADLDLLRNPDPAIPTLTWLGHSTVLLQYRGINVLTDPILSDRASPFAAIGPRRYTPQPLAVTELPRIDAVVVSHNHYDHLDLNTVRALGNSPHWFIPLSNGRWFADQGITNVTELDWWQGAQLGELQVMATPSQHWSKRGMFDTNESLWASWVVQWSDFKFWFAGDTGYNDVQFKQIGERAGPFDLAAIPIGAYSPRWFMQTQHVNPHEAVTIHREIRSEYSFGIHWGTYVLTTEPVDEPPRRLAEARAQQHVAETDFEALVIGRSYRLGRRPDSVQ